MTEPAPLLQVLAGTNGAGKSSIGGAFLRATGGQYFNPDEVTREILAAQPNLDPATANSLAWQLNVNSLKKALAARRPYAFETTLGGNTIPALLRGAAESGYALHIWYAGLDSPERHLARIAARVARGGHDIPADKVRARYRDSLLNLINLLPFVSVLDVFDNSAEQDPASAPPQPQRVLQVIDGVITHPTKLTQLENTPGWAKAVVARAFEVFPSALLLPK
jgi:predicted ABC-type ATPase